MGAIKFMLWTGCAVSLGVGLATVEFDGRTPLQSLERSWNRRTVPEPWERLKERASDTFEKAKDKLTGTTSPPREHHTPDDREALDKLIARRPRATR